MIEDFSYLQITLLNYKEYIKYIESLCRKSKEYKAWVAFIYDSNTFVTSPDYSDIVLNDNDDFTSEVHHTVFTLYDIVEAVTIKLLEDKDYVTSWDVSKEVMNLHLADKICCAILSKSYHEAVHLGLRKIDINTPGLHLGNSEEFVKEYKDYLMEDKISEYEKLSGITYEEE